MNMCTSELSVAGAVEVADRLVADELFVVRRCKHEPACRAGCCHRDLLGRRTYRDQVRLLFAQINALLRLSVFAARGLELGRR